MTEADDLNDTVASHWYVFGGQIVYPRSEIDVKDFVVRSSDILYLCETDKYKYGTVTCAMSKLCPSSAEIILETSDEENSGNEGETLLLKKFIYVYFCMFMISFTYITVRNCS